MEKGLRFAEFCLEKAGHSGQRFMCIRTVSMDMNLAAMRANQGQDVQDALSVDFVIVSTFRDPDFRLELISHFDYLCGNSSMNTHFVGNYEFLFQNQCFSKGQRSSIASTPNPAVS